MTLTSTEAGVLQVNKQTHTPQKTQRLIQSTCKNAHQTLHCFLGVTGLFLIFSGHLLALKLFFHAVTNCYSCSGDAVRQTYSNLAIKMDMAVSQNLC